MPTSNTVENPFTELIPKEDNPFSDLLPANPFSDLVPKVLEKKSIPNIKTSGAFSIIPNVLDLAGKSKPISKALGGAIKTTGALQAAGAGIEGLVREEATATPVYREAVRRIFPKAAELLPEESLKNLTLQGIKGETVSRFTLRQSELGDIFRELGTPEPLAAFGGFLLSFTLPSNFAIGGIFKHASGATKQIAKATKDLEKAGGNYLKIIEGTPEFTVFEKNLKDAVSRGQFPDIVDKIRNKTQFKMDEFNAIKNEIAELEGKVRGAQYRSVVSGEEFPISEFKKELAIKKEHINAIAQGRVKPKAIFIKQSEKEAIRDVFDEFIPSSEKSVADRLVKADNSGSYSLMPEMGKSRPKIVDQTNAYDSLTNKLKSRRGEASTEELTDIAIRRSVLSPIKDTIGDIMLPEAVLSQSNDGAKIFESARKWEVFQERMESTFKDIVHESGKKYGVKNKSIEAKQVSLLMDSFDDAKSIPIDESFKDVLIRNLKQSNPDVSMDTIINKVDELFPSATVSQDVVNMFDQMRRNVTKRIANLANIPEERKIEKYITRMYVDLTKDMSSKDVAKTLDAIRDRTNVDQVLHQKVLREMGIIPKEKFFGPLSETRARNLPQTLADELFLRKEYDVFSILDSYIRGSSLKVSVDKFLSEARPLVGKMSSSIGLHHPLTEYTLKYMDAYRGIPSGILNNTNIRKLASLEGMRQLISKLGGRTVTALVNLTQTPLNTLPTLIKTSGFKGGTADFIGGLVDYFSSRGQALIKRGGVSLEVPEIARDLSYNRGILKSATDTSLFLFDKVEKFNRGVAFLSGKRTSERAGLTARNAINFSRQISDVSQFIMGRSNRPLAMQNPLGSTIGRFKIYSFNQLNFMVNTFKDPKAAATYIGVLSAIVGPDGMPFIENMRQQLNERHPDSNLTKALNGWQRASLSGRLGVDLSSLGIGFPFWREIKLMMRSGQEVSAAKDALFNLLGPSASDAASFISMVSNVIQSGITERTKRELIRFISIEGNDIREAIEVFKNGKVTDDRGRTTYIVPKEDALKFALGFNTPELIEQRRLMNRRYEAKLKYENKRKLAIDLYLDGQIDKAMNIIQDGVFIEGRKVPIIITPKMIKSSAYNRVITSVERQEKRLPKALK